ncbi:aminoglycoside N(6')-acetyltransferase [Halobacillus andaensis]|uniref:Aminoglycoside N(6')-acetyltransferase n=1 Tax=Halobacillus andaensis TaxID=1176239 RepID=A0A917EYL1_HALAA|nr:GNAT family protein [Halobacillus andaensis]MBP2005893.1 RimJ/RimL family protein N-acetyltransferase [Halobacillus andaensis]GGF25275.1 aminoglycoside N(6')-acetyltransferase [Halobacillus andaensis]
MIKLEYFTKQDYDTLLQWVESPSFLLQWAGPTFSYPLSDDQLDKYIKEANQVNGSLLIFKAVEESSNRPIGHIGLKNIDYYNRSARVGKVLVSKEARGRGIGLIMMEEILKIAFDELNLNKVTLGVFDFNKPAIQTYKKAGFQIDGLLRDHRRFEEEYWNLYEMSILHSEWKANSRIS